MAGARKYNVTPGQRFGYWRFFAGADSGPDPPLVYHRWDGRFVIAIPTDAGLYQVILLPDTRFLSEFREDRERAFTSHATACSPVARTLEGAHAEGKMLGMLRFECFLREASGPGWALAGDAGHFKDPAPGQGISDAFRQVEALAPVIVRAIHEPPERLDQELKAWARWRDGDAAEHYWLAADFGAAGRAPAVVVEATRRLYEDGRSDELVDVFLHRRKPSRVFAPALVLGATASALRRPGVDRGRVLRELRDVVVSDSRRRRLNRRPEFARPREHRDTGETEVAEEVAA
jgi:2-polyprenyl-6-methoxyphenol hydroxylase-like FAD-dependent oxidoreductase